MNQLKYICQTLLALILQPEETWQRLAKSRGPETQPEEVQKDFFLPLLGYMSLIVFVCAALRGQGTFDYQLGMKSTVPVLIAYFMGPFLSIMLLNLTLTNIIQMPHPDKNRVQVYVYYCTSFLMVAEVLLALIPSVKFFKFIILYLLYITFGGSVTFIRVPQDRRWFFGIIAFALIWSCPWVISALMHRLQG